MQFVACSSAFDLRATASQCPCSNLWILVYYLIYNAVCVHINSPNHLPETTLSIEDTNAEALLRKGIRGASQNPRILLEIITIKLPSSSFPVSRIQSDTICDDGRKSVVKMSDDRKIKDTFLIISRSRGPRRDYGNSRFSRKWARTPLSRVDVRSGSSRLIIRQARTGEQLYQVSSASQSSHHSDGRMTSNRFAVL